MSDGYSRSPKSLKGALVEFSKRFIGAMPNVIIFQYNPEQLTRTLASYAPPDRRGITDQEDSVSSQSSTPANAQPDDPTETFSLKLDLDATDALENSNPVTVISGVADRLAALEMLLYPQENSLSGLRSSVSGSLGGAASGTKQNRATRNTVPIVLFVWGPGRIVPVRITSFSVEELFYSPTLYPIHCKVTIGLRVLNASELESEAFRNLPGKDLALAAYKYSLAQKKVLAAANIANSVESILGLLPF